MFIGWHMQSSDLEANLVETAYARWAPIYDAVCGPVMVKGRRAAAAAARAIGGSILEVGVGTGLSFDDYDASTEITGIDLSAPMLAKAREKMASGRYPWVRDVQLMDAHRLAFADATFDCVVAQFVITLVANPEQVGERPQLTKHLDRLHDPAAPVVGVLHRHSPRGDRVEARRADHPRQPPLFGNRHRRGGRALGRQAHARDRSAARISVRAIAGLGRGPSRRHPGRAAQSDAIRHLYAGLFRTIGARGGVTA